MELTADQQRAAFHDGGNLVVEAAPGAGKTRVIVARVGHLVAQRGVDPARILVLTFSRRAVRELRDRLAAARPDLGARIDVRTFHGFASRLLAIERVELSSGRLIAQPAAQALAEQAFARVEPRGFAPHVFRSPSFQRDAERALADLARADDAVLDALLARGSAEIGDLVRALRELRALRRELGVTDFDDLITRAAALAREPDSRVAAHLRSAYDHVLVDEFQDTDPHQVALLAQISATIFAVGDAAQAIYGFRGAARNAIDRAVTALRMQRERLRTSHRCAPAICAAINETPGLPPEQQIATRVDAAGEVRIERAATPLDEAELAAEHAARAIAAGIAPERIAVLLRSAEPLGPFIEDALHRRGIRAARVGGDALVREPIVRALFDALHALLARDPERWIDCFCAPALGYARLALTRAFDRLQPRALDDAIVALASCGDGRIAQDRIAATLREAHALLARGEVARAARAIARGFDLLGAAAELDDAAAARAASRLQAALAAIGDTAEVLARLGAPGDAREVLARVERDASELAGEPPSGAVAILTVHAAKGLEFDTVVLCDAADGRMPLARRRDGIIAERDAALARELGLDLGDTPEEHLAEERALWYVALSRAERTLVIASAAAGADGAPQYPSRFLSLAARERAGQSDPYFAPLVYAGADTLPPPPDERPVAVGERLGVTRLDDWFTCERRFFYSTVVGLQRESAFIKSFGIAIHRVLERYHRVARRIDARWNRDDALRDLLRLREAVWNEPDVTFDSTLERDAAAATADRMLRGYAEHLATESAKDPFEVELLEDAVEVRVGDRTLRGRIDRVDRLHDGTRRIVDIKTGIQYVKLKSGLPKFVEGVDEGTLYTEPSPSIASVQLPLYRRALPDATIALLHLRTNDEKPVALDTLADADTLLASVDDAIERGFTQRIDEIARFGTTQDRRQCDRCAFTAICDGYLEAFADE